MLRRYPPLRTSTYLSLFLLFSFPVRAMTHEIVLGTWIAEIDPNTLSVTAKLKKSGITHQISSPNPQTFRVDSLINSKSKLGWSLPDQNINVSIQEKEDRLHIRFTSSIEQSWTWPLQEHATAFIIPDGEGLYLPTTDKFWIKKLASGYCQTLHSGLSMPFWGIETSANHFVFLVETDLHTEFCLDVNKGRIVASTNHLFQKRDGLGTYEIIIAPTNSSPIGPSLEYRKYLEEKRQFVSLKTKIYENPQVEKLMGASHAYLWGDGRTAAAVREYAQAGLDRMWLGYDQDPRSDKHIVDETSLSAAKDLGFLIGPYDTLDNIQPARSSDSVSSIFDDELYASGCVMRKDGKKMTGFAGRGCQLSSEALRLAKRPFLKERVDRFKASGANSYFIDCDAFGDFLEDYDQRHPMTKGKDRENRSVRMQFVAGQSKMVLGSEGGTAWSTQYVHFLHGAHDTFNTVFWPLLKDKKKFGTWWPPEAMGVFFKKVKVDQDFMTAKYSPNYRLPLFQTVFHDSVVSTERWEMSLSKIPAAAHIRALFWQLYNVAPIWNLNIKEWQKYKDRIVEHHKFFSEVHRALFDLPISNFEWLTEDHSVQRITFANKFRLTANFSSMHNLSLDPMCLEFSSNDKKINYCPKKF